VRAPHAGSDPAHALERAADWIAEMLGAPRPAAAGGGFGDPLTLQLYALARHRFNTRGALAARSYLETLLDLDPRFARARVLYGRVLWDAGEVRRAEEIWRAALGDLEPGAAPHLEADLLYELVWLEADRGRFPEAEALLARLRRLAERAADAVPVLLDVSAYVAAARGDSARAIRLYRDLVEATRERHDLFYLEVALNNLIDELLNDHQPEAARPLIDEALALARVTANTRMGSHLHLTLAKLALARGDRGEVERQCRAALAVAGPATNPFLAAQVEQARLEARIAEEGVRCCLAEIDRVSATYHALDDHRRAADLRILAARLLRDSGHTDLARRQLDDVRRHGGPELLRELAPDLAPPAQQR
jgi:tetratricopeptide (TPR) repeat protein